ncbi:MAG: hypothetical protein GXO69_10435 [Acidobacteria bacterium]|nr:hypothetical protein [Acidobacteriota bacterium]
MAGNRMLLKGREDLNAMIAQAVTDSNQRCQRRDTLQKQWKQAHFRDFQIIRRENRERKSGTVTY